MKKQRKWRVMRCKHLAVARQVLDGHARLVLQVHAVLLSHLPSRARIKKERKKSRVCTTMSPPKAHRRLFLFSLFPLRLVCIAQL